MARSSGEAGGQAVAVQASAGLGPGGIPLSGVRAMVVEDEVALAEVLGSYLAREGFEVPRLAG